MLYCYECLNPDCEVTVIEEIRTIEDRNTIKPCENCGKPTIRVTEKEVPLHGKHLSWSLWSVDHNMNNK